jgi:hypothetical protein
MPFFSAPKNGIAFSAASARPGMAPFLFMVS